MTLKLGLNIFLGVKRELLWEEIGGRGMGIMHNPHITCVIFLSRSKSTNLKIEHSHTRNKYQFKRIQGKTFQDLKKLKRIPNIN
jgi:hypothetical protein